MTADLIAFLQARLDEDEQAARAAMWDELSAAWTARPPRAAYERYVVVDYCDDGVVAVSPENADTDGVGQHIARHDPARVLAEVEAKRKAVRFYEQAAHSLSLSAPGAMPHDLMTGAANTARVMLQALATPYADHPDYRNEWRP